jgi:hypothetical protein
MTDRKEQVAEIVRDARLRSSKPVRYTPEHKPPTQHDWQAAARIDALYAQQGEPVAWMVEALQRGLWRPAMRPFDSEAKALVYLTVVRGAVDVEDARVTPLVPAGPQEPQPEGERAFLDGFTAGAFWGARYRDERDMKPTGIEIIAQSKLELRKREPASTPAPEREPPKDPELSAELERVRMSKSRIAPPAPPEGGLVERLRKDAREWDYHVDHLRANPASETNPLALADTAALLRSAADEIEALRAEVGEMERRSRKEAKNAIQLAWLLVDAAGGELAVRASAVRELDDRAELEISPAHHPEEATLYRARRALSQGGTE